MRACSQGWAAFVSIQRTGSVCTPPFADVTPLAGNRWLPGTAPRRAGKPAVQMRSRYCEISLGAVSENSRSAPGVGPGVAGAARRRDRDPTRPGAVGRSERLWFRMAFGPWGTSDAIERHET